MSGKAEALRYMVDRWTHNNTCHTLQRSVSCAFRLQTQIPMLESHSVYAVMHLVPEQLYMGEL